MNKRIVAIELTNHCNIRCEQCPQGIVKIKKGFMSEEVFVQCLNHASGYTELNWRGESTMHPRLVDFVSIANRLKPNLDLGFHTNARTMNRELFISVAKAGLKWLHVSLHNEESCQKFIAINRWNQELAKPILVYAEADTTSEELGAVVAGIDHKMIRRNTLANWAGQLTGFKAIHADPAAYASRCSFIAHNRFVVSWDGLINACCWDWEMRHQLGSVSNFESISHAPVYERCGSCVWVDLTQSALEPRLVGSHEGYNIVQVGLFFYGVPQRLGPLDLSFANDRQRPEIILAETEVLCRSRIERLEHAS